MLTLAEVKTAKLEELRELRTERDRRERERLRTVDAFALLGYEPNCKPRNDVRKTVAALLGIESPFDQRVTEAAAPLLPEPCGQCPQEQFHSATEYDLLFGGSSGGGKTKALTAEALRACVRHPGIRVGAFRRTYPELKESLLAELAEFGYGQALGAKWNASEYELKFPNGSLIMFRYAETIKDATRRQGGQYQLLIFDERTLTPPDVIAFLESRLRSGRAEIPVLGIRSSTNPGGAGHGAVKKRYIAPTNYGERTYLDVRGRQVRFIPSKLSDNPRVNAEYAADLKALPDKLRAAFLDGNWDIFAGQMFSEMSRERHVVAPFTLPPSWQRYNGIDWGHAKPWAVLWAAIDEDGRAWFYREIHEAGVGEADQAKRILAAEADGEQIAVRYADDSMWAKRGDAKAISSVYADNGVYLTPANKGERVPGWQRVRSYLAEGPACPHHRALGWKTCPMLHMFSTLEEFYRTLSDLPHAATGNPEDADSTGEDHLPDAARYLLINLGTGPSFTVFDEPEKNAVAEAITPLEPMGAFAVDRDPGEPSWLYADDDDAPRRTVRTTELGPEDSLTAITERVPVAEISRQARGVRFGATALAAVTAVLFGIGWLASKPFGIAWLILAWTATAVRLGWQQARIRAEPGPPSGPQELAAMQAENERLRLEIARLNGG